MKIYALRAENPLAVLGHLNFNKQSGFSLQSLYDDFVCALIEGLERHTTEPIKVELHSFEQIEKIRQSHLQPNKQYINIDSQSKLGIYAALSRHFDLKSGKFLGITASPDNEGHANHIERLGKQAEQAFGLIEDDIFSGNTLRGVIKHLQKFGVSIDSIICGMSTTKLLDGIPVTSAVYYEPEMLLDMADPRDYILCGSKSGLVVSHRGEKFRAPYHHSIVDLSARSNIHSNGAAEFSCALLEANRVLHAKLGSLSRPAQEYYPKVFLEHIGLELTATIEEMINALTQRMIQLNPLILSPVRT